MTIDTNTERAPLTLVLEAQGYFLLARGVLLCWSFERVAGLFSRPLRSPELTGEERALVRSRVKQSVFVAWRLFPRGSNCFHRALAAYWMLRKRGVSTQLYYGASTQPERGLTGHVWLMDGDVGIVGIDAAKGLPLLARFPALPAGDY